MPTRDRALSRRSILKSAMAATVGLATAGNIPPLISQSVGADDVPLRDLGDRVGFGVGTFFQTNLGDSATLAAREFNLLEPSGHFSLNWIYRNGLNNPDFKFMTTGIAFANKYNMALRAGPLFYHVDLPPALSNGPLAYDDMKNFAENHIDQVYQRLANTKNLQVMLLNEWS